MHTYTPPGPFVIVIRGFLFFFTRLPRGKEQKSGELCKYARVPGERVELAGGGVCVGGSWWVGVYSGVG